VTSKDRSRPRIAVHWPAASETPMSLMRYARAVCTELAEKADFIKYRADEQVYAVDLIWDPFCGWSQGPVWPYTESDAPRLITFHGAAALSMKAAEFSGELETAIKKEAEIEQRLFWWLDRFAEIDGVLTPSLFAAREIEEVFGIDSKNIKVIYHGVDRGVFYASEVPRVRHGILHVSSWQPKKNIERLLRSVINSKKLQRETLELVVPSFPFCSETASYSWLRVHQDVASDAYLREHYQTKKIFVFPSLHETFGLPVLEAMACGCPVVCARGSALAEIYSDAALLVDPYDVEDIGAAMITLIDDCELRKSLVSRGLELAGVLTWSRRAARHLEYFNELL